MDIKYLAVGSWKLSKQIATFLGTERVGVASKQNLQLAFSQ